MGGRCEQLLDRHFKQQIDEFGPIFMQIACNSDQSIISYWLQVFEAAPRPQKWARNCMMLLLFGHLEEFGYLQIPFTDMRNCGRDLNEILDGYQGLVMQVPTEMEGGDMKHKFQNVLTPSLSLTRNNFKFVMKASKKCSSLSLKSSSAHTFIPMVPKNVSFEDCELKSLSSILIGISDHMKLPPESFDSHRHQTNIELVKTEGRIIHELQELYSADTKEMFPHRSESSIHDRSHSRVTQKTRSASTFRCSTQGSLRPLSELTNKKSETDDSKLKSFYERYKENLPENCQQDVPLVDVKFNDLVELMAKYNNYIKLDKLLLSEGAENSNLPDLNRAAERLAENEEILKLLKKNEMLRRECLKYYTMNGVLRPHVKQLKKERSWAKGLVIGAYRALHRYARCRRLVRGQGKFKQLQNCKHGWRCYRRLMIASCAPYCRTKDMHSRLDSKRQGILMRMSHLLRLKQVYAHIGNLQLDRIELMLLLDGFERKYLKLANELHFIMFKIVK